MAIIKIRGNNMDINIFADNLKKTNIVSNTDLSGFQFDYCKTISVDCECICSSHDLVNSAGECDGVCVCACACTPLHRNECACPQDR